MKTRTLIHMLAAALTSLPVMFTAFADPATTDTDGDGITDEGEGVLGTDPNIWDTDGDGLGDDDEVNLYLSDPLSSSTEGLPDQVKHGLGLPGQDMNKVVSGSAQLRYKMWNAERNKIGFQGFLDYGAHYLGYEYVHEWQTYSRFHSISMTVDSEKSEICWDTVLTLNGTTTTDAGIYHGVPPLWPGFTGSGIGPWSLPAQTDTFWENPPVDEYSPGTQATLSSPYTDEALLAYAADDMSGLLMSTNPPDWGQALIMRRPRQWLQSQQEYEPEAPAVAVIAPPLLFPVAERRHMPSGGATQGFSFNGAKLARIHAQATASNTEMPADYLMRTVLLEVHRAQADASQNYDQAEITNIRTREVFLQPDSMESIAKSIELKIPPPSQPGTVEVVDGYVDLRFADVSEQNEDSIGKTICLGESCPFSIERDGSWYDGDLVYTIYMEGPSSSSQAVLHNGSTDITSGSQISSALPSCLLTPDVPGTYTIRLEVASTLPGDTSASPLLVDKIVIHALKIPTITQVTVDSYGSNVEHPETYPVTVATDVINTCIRQITLKLLKPDGTPITGCGPTFENGQRVLTYTPSASEIQPPHFILPGLISGTYKVRAHFADSPDIHVDTPFAVSPEQTHILPNLVLQNHADTARIGELVRIKCSPAGNLIWTVTPRPNSQARYTLLPKEASGSVLPIQISPTSGPGELLVSVRKSSAPPGACSETVRLLTVGCGKCETTCDQSASATMQLRSLHLSFPLGAAHHGRSAGSLHLDAEHPSAELATPKALVLNSFAPSEEVFSIYTTESHPRQIATPDFVIEINVITNYIYALKYHLRTHAGVQAENGLFSLPEAPFRTYTISNPAATNTVYNTLQVKDSGNSGSIARYSYNPNTHEWTLVRGMTLAANDPLYKEVCTLSTTPDISTKTYTIFDPANNQPKFKRSEVWDAEGRLIQEIVDPGGLQLTTTHTYDAATGDLLTTVDPTGKWTKWVYDSQRRVTHEYHTRLDYQLASYTSGRRLEYDYTPIAGSADSNHPDDAHLPRVVTEFIGFMNSRTWHVYQRDAQSGDRTVTTRRATVITGTSSAPAWNDPANEVETVVYNADSFTDPFAARVLSRTGSDGQTETYIYDTGVLGGTINNPPENWTFSTGGQNTFVRTRLIEGVAGNPNGVPMRNTVRHSIVDLLGRSRLTQVREVSTDTILEATGHHLDGHGRPTSTSFANGTYISRGYGCCGPSIVTDFTGATTTFLYDRLGRPYQEIRSNRNGDNVTLTRVYDPIGAIKSETTATAGLPSQTSTTLYDAAGRVYEQQDPLGGLTRTSYPSPLETRVYGPLQTDIANPTVADHITKRFLDGRIKSITGQANTPGVRYYYTAYVTAQLPGARLFNTAYNLNAAGVDTGARSDTHTDALGRVLWTAANSSPTHRLRSKYTYSASKPRLLLSTSHAYSADNGLSWIDLNGVMRSSTSYDELNQPLLSGMDISGTAGVPDEASSDRITKTTVGYVMEGGIWWSESKTFFYPVFGNSTNVMSSATRVRLTGLGGAGPHGVLAAESRLTDRHGNHTYVRRYIDRASRKETTLTDSPESVVDALEVRTAGVLTSTTDSFGMVTSYTHDGFDRVLTQTNGAGTSSRTYDSLGRLATSTDVHAKVTIYNEYLPHTALPTLVTEPLGRTTRTEYDGLGRAVKVWGTHPTPTWTEYDDHGRVAKLHTYQDPSLDFTQATWPASAGAGQVTTWTYDLKSGLLTQKAFPDGSSHLFTYDEFGRLKTRSWARLNSSGARVMATYSRNPHGDNNTTTYNDGTPTWWAIFERDGHLGEQRSGPVNSTAEGLFYFRDPAFAYEVKEIGRGGSIMSGLAVRLQRQANGVNSVRGRVGAITDNVGASGYYIHYDNLGRVAMIGSESSLNYKYTYVENTRKVAHMKGYLPIWDTAPHFTTAYNRGAGYRISSVVNTGLGAGNVISSTYEYDDAGRRTRETRGDGSYWQHGYTDRDELTGSVKYAGGGTSRFPGLTNAYTYDNTGNRLSWQNGGDIQGANTRTFTYQRNNLNQYTSISPVDPYDVTGEAAASATVTIDGTPAQRNGPWFRGEFNAANDTTAAYPGNLVQVVSGGVTNTASVSTFVGPNNTSFTYDADGNLTRDARWDYTWDAENRCTKMATRTDLPASVPRITVEYTYDAAGNRLRKLVLDGAGIVTSNTRYMWLGNMLMSEWSPSTLLRGYWWGVDANGKFGGEEGIGALVMCNGISTEAGPMWNDYSLMNYAQDGNGNIVGQFDHFYGTKWREYEYDGFGRMVAERKYGGSAHLDKVPLRHATRILDPETGLQAYHYRLYSPWLGRWLSRDPIGEAGGLNLYGMVGNNPVNNVDPLGLDKIRMPVPIQTRWAYWTDNFGPTTMSRGKGWSDYTAYGHCRCERTPYWDKGSESVKWSTRRGGTYFDLSPKHTGWGIQTCTIMGEAPVPANAEVLAEYFVQGVMSSVSDFAQLPDELKDLVELARSNPEAFAEMLPDMIKGIAESSSLGRAAEAASYLADKDGVSAAHTIGQTVGERGAELAMIWALRGLKKAGDSLDEIVAKVRAAGKYDTPVLENITVAREIARRSFPDAVELPPAVAGQPYPPPPPGVKKWFQIHPAEPGVNDFPHIKYADWTNGKKHNGGSYGHIFFRNGIDP